ncbi:MAG: DHH family phosphoesterase [Ruminococcus sp.]|nr:DHH family phosphoesterase [Ruminococcus sp.]
MTVKDLASILKQNNNFEILTHNYPDGDCLGCGYGLCLALRQIGKNANVITTDMPKNFSFITDKAEPQDFEPEFIVSTDVADTKLLGKNEDKYKGRIDMCIDHHGSNTIEAQYRYVDSEAAAAGEIIFELIKELGAEITVDIANCLYTALSTDTGCFCYVNTTSRTLRIAADLLDLGCDSAYINKVMFETKTKRRIELERDILDKMIFCADDKCAMIYTTCEMVEGMGDDETEGIASIPRQIEGVKLGITIREKQGGEYKVSARTNGDVDACAFCAQFGGGGHIGAAGCTIKGTLESTIEMLRKAAEKTL